MHRKILRLLRWTLIALALICGATPVYAQLRIDVTQGNVNPLPIAVPDFVGTSPEEVMVGQEVARVVRANFDRSGLFRVIDPKAYLQANPSVDAEPVFGDWKAVNAQALVVGQVRIASDGRLQIEFRLWDVLASQLVTLGPQQEGGLQFTTTKENWRKIAHKLSDAIYERITGDKGYFDTRIVFVFESGPKIDRRKKLAVMDQDGANPSFLPTKGDLALTPRFSPSAQQITYLSFANGKPRVYLLNIETGRQEVLGEFAMSFAPRFAPNGQSVLLSVDLAGNSEIYAMDLRSGKSQRLTNDDAIDTSPSFSPDAKFIAFNSDRGGSSQLYVMKADGSDPKRISFGEGRYSTPVWSPRGDLIAFTKQLGGRFYIGVMGVDGSGERILTDAYRLDGPDWSPNGRVIVFSREPAPGAPPALYSVDITGRTLQRLPTRGDASDPAWSPLLP